ncbi:gluconate 2-dehydrogenase subunit 3 family protein [Burkholderia sp. Ac-20379]|uniref:gluconate 2-dehydrogenase subunit 3 family protein n=1 Tax=Burkholderia sp. Ac-20379 TaxID=2703900 RepID=UPI0019801A95|nr:gluconate 2-dehydrogenase subunit 3 family protein [Burkholderia sp. Ac-20379]MBN3724624.1 gluconate 2-dehydrogenase subunit 3 family protein [Burkholderia sp. Ac-20379]
MKNPSITPGRRAFLRGVAVAAPAAIAVGGGYVGTTVAALADGKAAPYQPTFFDADEWRTLNALVDRMIPSDALGPGALEAGVAEFIDRQMNTPYGIGGLWYMHGPFHPDASPLMGYQLSLSPRELYRAALGGLDRAMLAAHGKRFLALDEASKDAAIGGLEHGTLQIGAFPSEAFFDQMLKNTREGYFCDPAHGGNKSMGGWRMIGFPGARADYMDAVEQYGQAYTLPPVSIV